MSSLLKSSFLHNLKTFILEFQINGSFPFFEGFLFIRSLNYTPKIRSLSQKLWPQAIVKKGFKICMVSKIKKANCITIKIKNNFFWNVSHLLCSENAF